MQNYNKLSKSWAEPKIYKLNKMIRIGNLNLDNLQPSIAVSFSQDTNLDLLPHYVANGLKLIEVRFDLFSKFEVSKNNIVNKIKDFNLPTLFTIRTESEGGKWNGSSEKYLKTIESNIDSFDAFDLEISMFQKEPDLSSNLIKKLKKSQKKIIGSYHNFNETPNLQFLSKILNNSHHIGADITKVATMINNQEDIATLTNFAIENKDKKIIIIGMGDIGKITRLSMFSYGSLLTFAYVGDSSTAPGQIRLEDLFHSLKSFYPDKK